MHVVLVLPDAYRLRVDFHEFGERVLQAAPDGNGPAHRQVEVGKFLARYFRRRIHRRAGLRHRDDHDISASELLQRRAHERLGLAPGRPVAHRYRLRRVFLHYNRYRPLRLRRLLHRIDYRLAEILASRVHHRHLAAGANARVNGEDGFFAERACEQEVAQVVRENFYRRLVRFELLLDGDVYFATGREQPLEGVFCRQAHLPGVLRLRRNVNRVQDVFDRLGLVHFKPHPEYAFLLASPDGEVAVRGDGGDGFGEIVVLLEFGGFGRAWRGDFALYDAFSGESAAHEAAHVRVVGYALGQDVAGILQVFVAGRERLVRPNGVGKRLEAEFFCDLGASAAFRLVGLVEVFEGRLHPAFGDFRLELRRKLALLVDGFENRLLAFFELAVVFEAFFDFADLDFVEVAVLLLAVAGDEGDGATVGEEFFDGGDLSGADAGFGAEVRQDFFVCHGVRRGRERCARPGRWPQARPGAGLVRLR